MTRAYHVSAAGMLCPRAMSCPSVVPICRAHLLFVPVGPIYHLYVSCPPAAHGVQDAFEVNVQDARFASIFTNRDYAIDPTRPEFKFVACGRPCIGREWIVCEVVGRMVCAVVLGVPSSQLDVLDARERERDS